MRYIAILTIMISFLYAEIKDPYQDISYLKLKNGLQVYILSDEKSVNTKINLTVGVGMDTENDKNHGISHLVEHIIFRDQRVPFKDYTDYLKKNGATYVNAYTQRYKTNFVATIDSNKSYWIVEKFADMLFDKKITIEDLEIEKGAVQTEIGNFRWTDMFSHQIKSFFKMISKENKSIYETDFQLKKIKELPASYLHKINNQRFTMKEVLQHYDTYYYPSNMILKIVGSFDSDKMRDLIQNIYTKIRKKCNKKVIKPLKNPVLNHKPYEYFAEGKSKNIGYIGAKYILENYKKYIIIEAYMDSIALRLQQKLRNNLGKTYSIYAYNFGDEKAQIASIYFDGLHEDFEENIAIVQNMIDDDIKNLSDFTIEEALKSYSKIYTSIEHDSDSLLNLINLKQYLVEEHHNQSTPIEIFKTITNQEFKTVIKNTFKDENRYTHIYRNYYFFPHDVSIILILGSILFIVIYSNLNRIGMIQNNINYSQRDVIMSRRISNHFLGFIYFVFISIFALNIWEWVKYLFLEYIMKDYNYIYSIDVPYSYIFTIFDLLIFILIFSLLCKYIFKYWAKIEVTTNALYIIGHTIIYIPKEDIIDIKVERWSLMKSIKSLGISILFWKPLVQISLKNGTIYYLRSKQAKHLEEDLKKVMFWGQKVTTNFF